jgi:protein-S-isoprenylcysteine O-methyltransferase Ste14
LLAAVRLGVVRFARDGRGTLAPIDPPRFVVRGGAYRVVRNPMYVANVAIVTGSGMLFESWRPLV